MHYESWFLIHIQNKRENGLDTDRVLFDSFLLSYDINARDF